jgi:hypothetical protein
MSTRVVRAQSVHMKIFFARSVSEHGDLLPSRTSSAETIGTIDNALRGRRGILVDMLNSVLPLLVVAGAGEAPPWPPWAWRSREPAPGRPAGRAGAAHKRRARAEAAPGSGASAGAGGKVRADIVRLVRIAMLGGVRGASGDGDDA